MHWYTVYYLLSSLGLRWLLHRWSWLRLLLLLSKKKVYRINEKGQTKVCEHPPCLTVPSVSLYWAPPHCHQAALPASEVAYNNNSTKLYANTTVSENTIIIMYVSTSMQYIPLASSSHLMQKCGVKLTFSAWSTCADVFFPLPVAKVIQGLC